MSFFCRKMKPKETIVDVLLKIEKENFNKFFLNFVHAKTVSST